MALRLRFEIVDEVDIRRIRLARFALIVLIVIAIIGAGLGLVLVDRMGQTYEDALVTASDGAAIAASMATEAAPVVGDLAELGEQVQVLLGEVDELLVLGAGVTEDLGVAATTNLAVAVEGIASIADRVAGVVETFESFIPGNRESAAEDLRAIADGLEPIPAQLRQLGDELEVAAAQIESTRVSIEPIADQIEALSAQIAATEADIDDIAQLATDVQQRADDALDRLNTDLWLWRALVIIVALAVIAAAVAGLNALPRISRQG